jgi:hypothetical protein
MFDMGVNDLGVSQFLGVVAEHRMPREAVSAVLTLVGDGAVCSNFSQRHSNAS